MSNVEWISIDTLWVARKLSRLPRRISSLNKIGPEFLGARMRIKYLVLVYEIDWSDWYFNQFPEHKISRKSLPNLIFLRHTEDMRLYRLLKYHMSKRWLIITSIESSVNRLKMNETEPNWSILPPCGQTQTFPICWFKWNDMAIEFFVGFLFCIFTFVVLLLLYSD